MEVIALGLIYRDPPITKEDLRRAQQTVEPVNFPSYEAVISEKAKALAVKMAEKAIRKESKEQMISK
jgi:hypothetical protein